MKWVYLTSFGRLSKNIASIWSYPRCSAHIIRLFPREIDHIIPLASANTKEEMIPLFNYKNLQPLLAEDNRRKSAKIL